MLVAVILAVLGAVGAPPVALAASMGPGFTDAGFIGAFVAESDGRQVYCMDWAASSPLGLYTSAPTTVTGLRDYNGTQLSQRSLAELNYVMGRWGQSSDPAVTMAVQMFVWAVADPSHYGQQGGDNGFIGQAPPGQRQAVLANLALMRKDAAANAAVDPSVSVSIAMRTQYAGTLTVKVAPPALSGSVVLTNARFPDGATSKKLGSGTYEIVGTPTPGVPTYKVSASASYAGAGLGARVNLYTTAGAQRLLGSGSTAEVKDQDTTPVIPLDFQPVIGTQVASKFVKEGDAFVDRLMVETVGVGEWIRIDGKPVPLTAKGTLYGPFESQPEESETVPPGAPVLGSEILVLDRAAGTYSSPGGLKAPGSGFYTWVWGIDKTVQGDYGKFIRSSFTDWFGRVAETHVGPFQPKALSKAEERIVVPGDAVADTITVWSDNGPWLHLDGKPIPVVFTGTAFQVPGTLPPLEGPSIPTGAKALGTVEVTAAGPGTYTSDPVLLPDGGFVSWVWEVRKDRQDPQYRDYIAENWADLYGIPLETTSVRHPVSITSEVREYNVHPDGRAFDTITVTGFPDNHGEFTGDGYWGGDLDEITHTVYGPFPTDEVLTDDLDLETAPVLTSIVTPARNGVYRLGYTTADIIKPSKTGYYVVVSDFQGDDRVQPYRSSPDDILERFYVPPITVPWVTVTTKAVPSVYVGDPFTDTAIIKGTVPEGSTLTFRAYGPYSSIPTDTKELEPFHTSEPIAVDGPGEYPSAPIIAEKAGLVFWVETLTSTTGEVLAEGYIGAPGEMTIVREKPPNLEVHTKAVPTVVLGKPAMDTAIVTGTVPAGTTLIFQAYHQASKTPTCTRNTLVFDTSSAPIPVPKAGEYDSPEVIFEKAGDYFWIETLLSDKGEVVHQGTCGADGETTTVTAAPPPSTPPPSVPELAVTGANDWMKLILPLALILVAIGVGLTASTRPKTGDADQELEEVLLEPDEN